MGIGDWGLGIGDWGLGPIPNPQSPILGIGDWAQSPIPNPQSPIPNPHFYKLPKSRLLLRIYIKFNFL